MEMNSRANSQESQVASHSNLESLKKTEIGKEPGIRLYKDVSHVSSRLSLTSLAETEKYLRFDSKFIKQMKDRAAQYRRNIAEKSVTLNVAVPEIIQRAQRAEILHQENKKLALKSYLR